MKEVKKLKLVQLSKNELDKKELNKLRGGGCCICGCGGGTAVYNGAANNSGDKWSSGGGYGNGSYG